MKTRQMSTFLDLNLVKTNSTDIARVEAGDGLAKNPRQRGFYQHQQRLLAF